MALLARETTIPVVKAKSLADPTLPNTAGNPPTKTSAPSTI